MGMIWSMDGVKERVASLVRGTTSHVDFAAGSGELGAMLLEENPGLHLVVTELSPLEWHLPAHTPVPLDLNARFDLAQQFQTVTLCECIEHLENPWQVFRQLYAHVAPGGTVVVTTPSIVRPIDAEFVRKEDGFYWFNPGFEAMYKEEWGEDSSVHITPILPYLFVEMARRAGFDRIRLLGMNGDFDPLEDAVMILCGRKP